MVTPEQRRIAAILDQADAVRAKRRLAIAHLESLTQSIFHDMFTDGVGDVVPLGDIAVVKGGKRLAKGAAYADSPTMHPYIRVSDLRGGVIETRNLRHLTPDTQQPISRYTVDTDDVIISIAGSIGLTASVPQKLAGANLTENAAKIMAKQPRKFLGPWLANALRRPNLQAQIAGKVGQVTIGKLALYRIEELLLSIPPLSLQREFLGIEQQISRQREMGTEASASIEILYSSLQSRAFQGALR